MRIILIIIVIAAVLCVLVLNFYFRIRVFKAYKYLVQNRIEFDTFDVFRQSKIDEVVQRYPKHKDGILDFMNNIRRSVRLASLLILLITAFASILMFMEE